jgi:hypothetical protein
VSLLRYFLYDIRHTYWTMFWREAHTARATLSAELLFQYHKLEKGLVMPGPRRLFGVEPAIAAMALCQRWIDAGYPCTDPVFVGAVETLAAHWRRLQAFSLDAGASVLPRLLAFLRDCPSLCSACDAMAAACPRIARRWLLGHCRTCLGAPQCS